MCVVLRSGARQLEAACRFSIDSSVCAAAPRRVPYRFREEADGHIILPQGRSLTRTAAPQCARALAPLAVNTDPEPLADMRRSRRIHAERHCNPQNPQHEWAAMTSEILIDVMILGAGGGGYPAAFRLAAAGLEVVLVDPFGNLGGDCLAQGCVPSKAVREAALARAAARKFGLFGLHGAQPEVDWAGVLRHKDRVQALRYAQHRLEIDAANFTFLEGRGRILDERRVEVSTSAGEVLRYNARYLIIATGSRPHRLAIAGAELAVTSHEFFRLHADLPFPTRLITIGGGYIGLETASMLESLGVETVVLEAAPQVLPGADPGIAAFVHERLAERLTLCTDANVTRLSREPGGSVRVHYTAGSEERSEVADCVLMASGREAVLPQGIEAIGLRGNGPIAVDSRLRTALPHVYAPGDVNGRSMLFHSALCQSWIAAGDILGAARPTEQMNFAAVPFTVFTDPEVAWVGLSEAQATRDGIGAAAVLYDYRNDARAQIFAETHGFIKLVFATATGQLIGAQVAGLDAAQLIAPLALAVHARTTAAQLRTMAFPHPMLSEGINKAARAFKA